MIILENPKTIYSKKKSLLGLIENIHINIKEYAPNLLVSPHNVAETIEDLFGQLQRGVQICRQQQMCWELMHGNYSGNPWRVDIRALLFRFCGSRLRLRVSQNVPETVLLDTDLVLHILENYFSNAIKYGGKAFEPYLNVSIRKRSNSRKHSISKTEHRDPDTGQSDASHRDSSSCLTFTVVNAPSSDHKTKMTEFLNNADSSPLFDNGYRALLDRKNVETTDVSSGHGLFIVKKCAKVLCGFVGLEFLTDQVNANLYIPCKHCVSKEVLSSRGEDYVTDICVYALDDDKMMRMILGFLFKKIGITNYKIFGEDANEISNFAKMIMDLDPQDYPDLILLDQNLDHPSLEIDFFKGTDIVKELRNKGYTGKICIRSANDSSTDIDMYLKSGADGFVPKSSESQEMLRLIGKMMNDENKDHIDESMTEVCKEFYETSVKTVKGYIEKAPSSSDKYKFSSAIHQIKGCAASLQLPKIERKCKLLRSCIENELPFIEELEQLLALLEKGKKNA